MVDAQMQKAQEREAEERAKGPIWQNMKRSELLIRFGFIKASSQDKYQFHDDLKIYEPKEGDKIDGNDADEEVREIIKDVFESTGFPAGKKNYTLVWDVPDMSLEEPYYWILDYLKDSFPEILKLEDSFAASENSAFFGASQQRMGGQQDRVSGILINTGKMVKELFQIVRELRIIKERKTYYDAVDKELEKEIDKRGRSEEITLKGIFVDLVQGGAKSAASVFGMARDLEFVTLPSLFFDAPPFKNTDEIEDHIKSLSKDFNKEVLRVLQRHLTQYNTWRDRTAAEHRSREQFQLKYLEQHYQVIQMYLSWLRPYLRHVNKLNLKEKSMNSADIVSAFEGSTLDIELLAVKKLKGDAHQCILASFNYRTRAELKVQQEGYQRGPVHIGKLEMNLRVYGWTRKQIDNYRKMKEKETWILLGNVSDSLHQAMATLGGELEKYLQEAQGKQKEEGTKKEAKEERKPGILEMFLGEFYTPSQKKRDTKKEKSAKELREEQEKLTKDLDMAAKIAAIICWGVYNNFKKAHQMVTW